MAKKGITTIHLEQSVIVEYKEEAKKIVKHDVKITNAQAFKIVIEEYKKLRGE